MNLERLSKPLRVQAMTLEPGSLIQVMSTSGLDYSMELIVRPPMGLVGCLPFLTCQRHSSRYYYGPKGVSFQEVFFLLLNSIHNTNQQS